MIDFSVHGVSLVLALFLLIYRLVTRSVDFVALFVCSINTGNFLTLGHVFRLTATIGSSSYHSRARL